MPRQRIRHRARFYVHQFTPVRSGLVCWLKSSDANTIISSGGYVSQWGDKSGNAYHATQPTGAAQFRTGLNTINGKNVLTSTDSARHMILPSGLYSIPSGNHTVFVVAKRTGGAWTRQELLSGNNSTDTNRAFFLETQSSGTVLAAQSNPNYGITSTLSITDDGAAHAFVMSRNGTTNGVKCWRDGGAGSTPVTGSNATLDNLFISKSDQGSWDQWNGYLAEYLIYNRALTNDELNLNGKYLKQEWGTPWTNV